jgi:hypothetical protein
MAKEPALLPRRTLHPLHFIASNLVRNNPKYKASSTVPYAFDKNVVDALNLDDRTFKNIADEFAAADVQG